jgi:hypothetical protein
MKQHQREKREKVFSLSEFALTKADYQMGNNSRPGGSGRRLTNKHNHFRNTIPLSSSNPVSVGVTCYSVDGRSCGLITNTHITDSTTFLLHHTTMALDRPVASSILHGPIAMMNGSFEIRPSMATMTARLHQAQCRIRAMDELRNKKCSRYVRDKWIYSSHEEHFQHAQTPCHLENWLAVNEAQILAHINCHQKHRRTGQRDITDFPPIKLPDAANFPPPPSDKHTAVCSSLMQPFQKISYHREILLVSVIYRRISVPALPFSLHHLSI